MRPTLVGAWLVGFAVYQWLHPTGPGWWVDAVEAVRPPTGGLDATFMNNCKLWDIAAGWLIAREAGAVVTRPDGSPIFPIDVGRYAGEELPTLAGVPNTHQRLKTLGASS